MTGSLRTVAKGGTLAAVFASGSNVYLLLATITPDDPNASLADFYTNNATASVTYSNLSDLSGTDVSITGNLNRANAIFALATGPTISATIQGSPVKVMTPVSGQGTWQKIAPQTATPTTSITGSVLSLADYSAFVGVFAYTSTLNQQAIPTVYYFTSTLVATSGAFTSGPAGPFSSSSAEVDYGDINTLSGQQSLTADSELVISGLTLGLSDGIGITANVDRQFTSRISLGGTGHWLAFTVTA